MKYHIKLMKRIDSGECKSDITEDELITRYVEPYIYGETIVINGTTMSPENLSRVKITKSENSITDKIKEIEFKDSQDRSPYKVFQSSPEWRAIDDFEDVTDKYIDVAPGSKKRQEKPQEMEKEIDNQKVFIVHGHDTELKNDVELFLRSVNLKPIVLHRQLDEGMTVIEKFEKHSDVNYAIILLTPDDVGFPIGESEKPEKERDMKFRARQNVIFEFGYFIGKLTRKNVCCIYKADVELPSDLNGLIYKQVNKTVDEVGLFLMKEIKNAGLNVKFE